MSNIDNQNKWNAFSLSVTHSVLMLLNELNSVN